MKIEIITVICDTDQWIITNIPNIGYHVQGFQYENLSTDTINTLKNTLEDLQVEYNLKTVDLLDFFANHREAENLNDSEFQIEIGAKIKKFDSEGDMLRELCKHPIILEKIFNEANQSR
jgi:hypothetical protein